MSDPRVALVTGGSGGIGRALVRRLAGDGFRSVVLDREVGPAPSGDVVVVQGDVTRPDDVERAVGAALDRFGQLDLVVNNAGIMIRRPVVELSPEDWSRVLDTNLTAAFLTARAAVPALRARRGAIVNIASTRAMMSEPDTEAYAASKGGLVALSHALAISLGPEIRVNSVSPGWIDTGGEALEAVDHEQHPAGRVGRPEDVADLVAWLASPAAGFVTGANFTIDGGMTRKMIYA